MGDERGRADEIVSMEEVARLDAALERLADDRRPAPRGLSDREAREHQLAAQLRLAREGVEAPTPAFLGALEREVGRAVARERGARGARAGVSRGRFLRAAAALAGGAGLGVAGAEEVGLVREGQRPHDLVTAGDERWYDIAAEGEVPAGGVKPFGAGGVLGFLLNDDGRLHAVSAICTHMGCRLKPDAPPAGAAGSPAGLHCLCHGSRFDRRGAVTAGLAPSPLPAIAVRVENGRVYARGTAEDV